MSNVPVDHTGKRAGRLVVVGPGPRRQYANGSSYGTWRCKCDCGGEIILLAGAVAGSVTKSCGCLYRETRGKQHRVHGAYLTPEYRAWQSMKRRCFNPKDRRYPDYGGRGITVCERWLLGDGARSGAECFLADMGSKPSPLHTMDRIEVNGNYEPGNCRWATYSEQNSNRRPYTRSG